MFALLDLPIVHNVLWIIVENLFWNRIAVAKLWVTFDASIFHKFVDVLLVWTSFLGLLPILIHIVYKGLIFLIFKLVRMLSELL